MKELLIDATVENIETVTAFVNEQLEALNCPIKAKRRLILLLMNCSET